MEVWPTFTYQTGKTNATQLVSNMSLAELKSALFASLVARYASNSTANLTYQHQRASQEISNQNSKYLQHSTLERLPSMAQIQQARGSGQTSANVGATDDWPAESLDVNIMLTIVYLAIFLIGVIGNVCNCLVIADSKNKYMKTATNYYLFSLSISDLLLLIFGLPHDIINLWHPSPYMFNQFVCISRGWISEASTYASVLVIVAFTVERYLAICHPLRAHTLSRLSRSIKIIFIIWFVASSCALVVVLQYGVINVIEKRPDGQEISNAQCTTVDRNEIIFELSVVIFFIIPMAVITILYVKLGYHLRQKTYSIKQNQINRRQSLVESLQRLNPPGGGDSSTPPDCSSYCSRSGLEGSAMPSKRTAWLVRFARRGGTMEAKGAQTLGPVNLISGTSLSSAAQPMGNSALRGTQTSGLQKELSGMDDLFGSSFFGSNLNQSEMNSTVDSVDESPARLDANQWKVSSNSVPVGSLHANSNNDNSNNNDNNNNGNGTNSLKLDTREQSRDRVVIAITELKDAELGSLAASLGRTTNASSMSVQLHPAQSGQIVRAFGSASFGVESGRSQGEAKGGQVCSRMNKSSSFIAKKLRLNTGQLSSSASLSISGQQSGANNESQRPGRQPRQQPIALNSTVNTANMQSVIKMLGKQEIVFPFEFTS